MNSKHEYQEKIKTKNGNLIQTVLTQCEETQKNVRTIINDYITRPTEKKLQAIYKNGYNSKSYCNIQQLRQNNVEDLYALKMMMESDYSVKMKLKIIHINTTSNYTQNTHYQHTKKNSPTTQKIEFIYTRKIDYMKVMNTINTTK